MVNDQVSQEIRAMTDLKTLLDEFESFKDNPQFHELGFSRKGPYFLWLDRLRSLTEQYHSAAQLVASDKLVFNCDWPLLNQATILSDYAFACMWSVQPELNRKARKEWKAKAKKLRKEVAC